MFIPTSLRKTLHAVIICGGSALLAGCASPKFPESGTVTPYDGKWKVNLDSQDNPNCNDTHGAFDVRYGYIIGLIEWRHENYDIWGQIDANGRMDGLIGQLGVTGATATVNFTANSATGTWKSKGCGNGTLTASKNTG